MTVMYNSLFADDKMHRMTPPVMMLNEEYLAFVFGSHDMGHLFFVNIKNGIWSKTSKWTLSKDYILLLSHWE